METSRREEERLEISDEEESDKSRNAHEEDEDESYDGEEDFEDEEEDYDEEYDSEYDEEDEEEDDNGMDTTMAHFFAMMAQMVEDDGDDEDSSDCPCPECRSRRFMEMLNGKEEEDEEEDEESVEDASPCCVCMRRKTLVTLPCCGAQSELTSSTRFCASCVNQCLVNDGCPPHPAWIGGRMGECPRCKHLMVQMRDGSLKKATMTQILYYLLGLRNPNYLQLFTILFSCEYMPTEVFSKQDAECLSHVCRWGLLDFKNGVYSLRKPDLVRKWVINNLGVEWENGRIRSRERNDDDSENDFNMFTVMGAMELAAICKDLVMQKKLFLALRLANRISLLVFESAGLLPCLSEWRTPSDKRYRFAMVSVTALNLYLWSSLLRGLARVVLSVGAILPACSILHSGAYLMLKQPQDKKKKGRLLKMSDACAFLSVLRLLWKWIPASSLWTVVELGWPVGVLGGVGWLLRPKPKQAI